MVFDFFKNLGQQRVDMSVNKARGKVMSAQSRVKGKAANSFNKAVDAPSKAAKGKMKGGKKPKAPKAPKRPNMPKGKKPKKDDGGGMGWFSKDKGGGGGGGGHQEDAYEPAEATVAIDISAMMAQTFQPCVGWVVVLNGELAGRDFRLVDGKNTMGTAANCDIVLTDPYLSSHHCAIRHENGEFTFVDLDSTNGSYVNERRCSREDLIDNDKIRLGRTEMKFKSLE
ncbi:MAG: FHA domain-containing protein [Myxococcales bacterium]|nr:FHA domain-containing protein [Myxococcales bacterium]